MAGRTSNGLASGLLPALTWMRGYQAPWLKRDLVAGLTLAAYLIPAGIGDASLAGLPASAGLYACLFSGLVFWLFTSSKQTSVTVTSAISLLVGASLAPLSNGDPVRHASLAATTAVLVAAMALTARMLRAGAIVNFISESVLIGFKCGVALHLAVSQLPKLCGFHGSHGDFWERLGAVIHHAKETNPASLITGVLALALLLLGKAFVPRVPWALVVVIGGLLVGKFTGLESAGVKMLGDIVPGFDQLLDAKGKFPILWSLGIIGAILAAAVAASFAFPRRPVAGAG